MQILNNYHKISGGVSEYAMQESVDGHLKNLSWISYDDYGIKSEISHIILREIHNPDVGRISDHVILINNRKTINIECKLINVAGVIEQAIDHLKWCDYSIICMPPDQGYIPAKYFAEIIKEGIGFWWWFGEAGLFEMIKPKFGRYNKRKIKIFRERAIARIKIAVTETISLPL